MLPIVGGAINHVRSLLVSPILIDLILVLILIEAIFLGLRRRQTQSGLPVGVVARMLLPGMFLLIAVRASLANATWPWVPAALAASLVAHLIDLRDRWRR